MRVIENCTSVNEPRNQFKSYEIIIVSNIIKNENNYSYTQTTYNPLEYEEYKFNNIGKDTKINELTTKNTDLTNTIDSMADMIFQITLS